MIEWISLQSWDQTAAVYIVTQQEDSVISRLANFIVPHDAAVITRFDGISALLLILELASLNYNEPWY